MLNKFVCSDHTITSNISDNKTLTRGCKESHTSCRRDSSCIAFQNSLSPIIISGVSYMMRQKAAVQLGFGLLSVTWSELSFKAFSFNNMVLLHLWCAYIGTVQTASNKLPPWGPRVFSQHNGLLGDIGYGDSRGAGFWHIGGGCYCLSEAGAPSCRVYYPCRGAVRASLGVNVK